MKTSIKARIAAFAAAVLAVPVLFMGSQAGATGEGQIERGDIYYAKNLTKGGSFNDPIMADKCDLLQYKVRMHNPGAKPVTNVNIKVNLPSGESTQNVSTATITAQNAFPATVSDTATVNLSSSQSISYVSGSTQLLDWTNTVVQNLPDGITGSGVNIGSVGVSIHEVKYVQFKAKVNCPKPPCEDNPNTPEDECHPCVDNPKTPGDECHPCVDNPKTDVNECKPETPPTPPVTPPSLPNTGPGDVIAAFFGVTSLSSILYYAVSRKIASL